MNCEELRPDYLWYALGVLEEPVCSEMRAHLDRGCADCVGGVREARQWAFAMGSSVEGPAPPRDLRRRVLAVTGAPQRRWSWAAPWVAALAAACILAGAAIYQARGLRTDLAATRTEAARNNAEAAALRQALDLIQAPDTREVTFGAGQPVPPRGRIFVNRNGVLLMASRLPAPPPGKTYEMWIIHGGAPAPAGLFASDGLGNAFHLYRTAAPAGAGDTVAVTLEAAGGVNAPTTTPVILAAL